MRDVRVAMLAPIVWRVPPLGYGPWELVSSLITEGMVKKGIDITLFATKSSKTKAKLEWIFGKPISEVPDGDYKVMECLHISHLLEKSDKFDLIHNNFDFLPLTYSQLIKTPMVTTIHGFSDEKIIPVYKKYNKKTFYVSISIASRHPDLDYIGNVYHGVDLKEYKFNPNPENYWLYLGRIHPDKGTAEAVSLAQSMDLNLVIAGIIQDENYFKTKVKPFLNQKIRFVGEVGGEEKVELLSRAKGLLHLISFEEPFGLSVIEAMACGTPVIAYNKGSMKEIIENNISGFIVNNFEEAELTIKRVNEIDRNKVFQRVKEKFTIEEMISGYLNIYEKIVSEH